MTALDFFFVALYFVLFFAILGWCKRYVKKQQSNPLDRGSNADKLPVGAQKKLRAGANQRLGSRKKR